MPASSDKNLPAIISDPADEVDEQHFGVMGNEPRTSLEDAELDQAVEDMFPRNPAKQRALPQGQDYTQASAYENVAYYMPALSST